MRQFFCILTTITCCLGIAHGENKQAPRELSKPERALVGRWQGNEQKYKNGWTEMDFYFFSANGSYVVAIRVFDPVEKKWKRPSDLGDPGEDGFDGDYYVKGKTLLLDNWFAARELEFELKEPRLVLRRAMLDATWTMTRVKKCPWETPELAAKLDKWIRSVSKE